MFSLDFFKGIDTITIHKQKPPIDKEIVDKINENINEEYDHNSKETQDIPKLHGCQKLFDNTVYEGEWLDKKRNGMGTLYKIDSSNRTFPQKIYSGNWLSDKKHGLGIGYYQNYTFIGEW